MQPTFESSHGAPARLLIIDDDELTTATFARMLRLEGHEVLTARSAIAALSEASTLAPDAIIVDLHMPGMDGLTFVKHLRAQEHGMRMPVAMVTGDYGMAPPVSEALAKLGVTICFKPLWIDDLIGLAARLLTKAG
ncbi:MAG TPA: response regulator [Vicinamibacterales bacterium]|jgi:CheY-like chemotaxis protein|nr:response regulator [Vicinamibacterales bacterium]